ncbi:MAG: hypothetical protein H6721_04570 [Sandaracinus sp.]|nr:hypothetical protein [Sandaracinus sp.]
MRRLVALALLSACGAHVTEPGPESALNQWAEALERGDAEAAHALLDPETGAEVSVESLRTQLAENPTEVAEHVAAVRATAPRARAVVRLANDERVVLHREDGRWKLSGDLLGVPTPTTPEDAVRALRRSLRDPALAGVLRVLARRSRAAIVSEVERFLEDTADELSWRSEVSGNDAVVRTAGGWTVRLVRESGEWRVEDVVGTTP